MRKINHIFRVLLPLFLTYASYSQSASWNYLTNEGNLGTTYSWVNCSGGTSLTMGDDVEDSFNWPFNFRVYDDAYTTSNSISISSNGFIRFDGTADANWSPALSYSLGSTSTELGQVMLVGVYDCKIGDNGGYVRYLVTGSAPNRVLHIEFNNVECDYNDNKYYDAQVSFYETSNVIVLKLGTENLTKDGVDMGIHSGVNTFYHDWVDVRTATNNRWIEYTPAAVPIQWSTSAATTDWNTGSNWDGGVVPTATDDVIIPAGATNYPVIDETNAVSDELNINSGAKITFNTGGKLTASGIITLSNGGELQFDGGELEGNAKFDWDGLVDLNSGTLDINGEIELSASTTEEISGGLIECAGDWDGAAGDGDFTPTFGTITMNGSTQNNLDCHANDNFYHLTIDKSSNGIALGSNIDVNGRITVLNGTLDATIPGINTNYTIGTGTSTTNQYSPYKSWWTDSRSQLLFRASELTAQGMAAGDEITACGWDISSKNSTQAYGSWTIKMAHTSSTTITNFESPAWTVVHTSNMNTVAGWNNHNFSTSFIWDGVSNIIVQTCHDNSSYDGNDDFVRYSDPGFNCAVMGYDDNSGIEGCDVAKDANGTNRANTRFTVTDPAGGYDIEISGDFTNDGNFIPGTGKVTLDGNLLQTIAGTSTTTFYNLQCLNTVSNANGVELTANVNVDNLLEMNFPSGGDLHLNGKTITLNSNASISGETTTDRIHGNTGKISHTINMSANSFAYNNIAGMGIWITTGAGNVPGSTLIERGHGEQTGAGNTSMNRFYDITPTVNTALGVTLKIEYFDAEWNGQTSNADVYLWRSTDAGSTWSVQGSSWTDATNDFCTLTGLAAFSRWTPSSITSNPLPVEMLNFQAILNENHVEISWQTATEINNDYFTIERSEDGTEWEEIAKIEGAGTTNWLIEYFEIDYEPVVGKSYYRVSQTDYDGRLSYSNVAPITYSPSRSEEVILYPNPSDGTNFILGIEEFQDSDVLIVIRDLSGKELFSKLSLAGEGIERKITLDTELATGTYLIIASSNDQLRSKTLFIR